MPATQRGTPQAKGASFYSASSRLSSRKPRISPGTAGLDLDPNAHSRTDPVKALGTLLKLLTSLSSRIGGCQYKLTPAEHTLSLHLVSIIDPFVCHGARALTTSIYDAPNVTSLSSLVDQPTEILDAILSHVDSRKDLLSIGLVCKRLRDIIFPRHFDYRVIRCKLSSISLWNHLIIHKSLARNVRKLEILDERSSTSSSTNSYTLTPSISQRDTDLENTDDELRVHSKQEKYLSEAILYMTGLEEFKWSCNHSPISIANIWPTLIVRAANLRTLEICDNLLFGPRFSSAESGDSSDSNDSDHDEPDQPQSYFHGGLMTRLPLGLLSTTNVVFRSTPHSFGAPKQPDLKRISRMLQKCPKLERIGTMGARRAPGATSGPSTNVIEWIDLLSTLPDLSTLHGVKFFYEVSSFSAEHCPRSNEHSVVSGNNLKSQFVVSQPMQMSMMERSRIRKNDEVAGVLAWKCSKLRWVDHWEDGSGKIIHLVRDHCGEEGKDKVRWEVKRLKCRG